ncbi:MAG: N-acetylmuramoyl-L-alanine amidase [Thermodesulfobacteriota bacterium]|nr:N-acetylmuramoyl-L-alanine amidase [Thermodesulfobacteriota bacterium]
MKRKFHYILLLISLFICCMDGSEAICKTTRDPVLLLERADKCRRSLYASAGKRKYRHNWLKCIRRYEKVYSRYSKSDQAAWALYHSARLYSGLYKYSGRSKDLENSLRLYRRLVDDYKGHRLADDAQYRIGEIFYKHKKDPSQAYIEFLKVDIKFPSGDMRHRAKKMLDKMSVILSKGDKGKRSKTDDSPGTKSIAVKDIRHWSTPNYTRVVIDVDAPVKYEKHLLKEDIDLKKPQRLYIDLHDSHVMSQMDRTITMKGGLLQSVRTGQYTKDTVRVVLDIESIGKYDVFHLYDPFRIVVDVRRLKKSGDRDKIGPTAKQRPVRKGIRKAESLPKKVSLARQLGLNVKRVVIDPGHGGKDPGCLRPGGLKEKNIVLSIAKILAEKLRKEVGCEVFLTRTKDVFLSLERRTAIANMKKADLFISLHVNAHRSKRIQGLETYFLNMATDKDAVMVAARENATSEKNISDLQNILNDLMLNTKIHESSRLAHEVHKGMSSHVKKKYKRVKNLGVKQAPFYVLIGAQMPAILVEAGFLTNYTERKRLITKKYQEEIAEGICIGIKSYIASIDLAYQGG